MYECACKRGECDKVTGECICPDGWYGLECQDGESSRTVARKNVAEMEQSKRLILFNLFGLSQILS